MNGNTLKTASIPPMKSSQKLIGAAQVGNFALVRRFLKKGADVHFVENKKLGYNALHYAAFNGHKDVIQELLNAGADVNAVTTDNYSAFMLATSSNEVLTKVNGAAQVGNFALVRRLLKKGADVHFVENKKLGYNALHYAAFNGHKDVIQELLNAGADVNAVTTDNYSAFMLATLGGFTEVVEMLLQTTQPDLTVTTKDESQPHNGLTCLHLAVMSGNNDIVFMLLSQGANAKAVTNMGYSVLHLAAELGHTPILSTLLSESVSIDRLQRTVLGNTALHLAVASGVRKSVAKLLQHSKAYIDVPDPDGYTALHMAVSYQLPYIVELLLDNGANVNTQSTTGQTPIMEAVIQGENVMVEMLTRNRADVTIPDHTGTTPLIAAAAAGDEENVRSILNHYSNVVASAVDTDSDPESIDIVYRVDIHSEEHIAQLCDHQNKEGHSAMSIATKLGYGNIVKRLMLAGASNITNCHVASNVTQEDCAAVKNIIENTGIDTAHTTSKFQDLHPLPLVSSEASSTCRSTVSTDSGDDGSSMHSDGILADSAAENLPSDRFPDLHAPSSPVTDLSSPSMISASGTAGKTIGTATKDTFFQSPENNIVASSSDRLADLRHSSAIREVLPVSNCPDTNGASTSECTKKSGKIQSEDDEWFVIPFDVSAYPVDDSAKVSEPLLYEAQIEVDTQSSNKSQESAAKPLISEQIKKMLIRIRKSAARQHRRKEMRTARRAALNVKNTANKNARSQKRGNDCSNNRSARKNSASGKCFYHKRQRVTENGRPPASHTSEKLLPVESEMIALKEALKQQTARVDQLTAQLESLQNVVMLHYNGGTMLNTTGHDHVEWDQEIEFVRNLEQQERIKINVFGEIRNNTADKPTGTLSKFDRLFLEGLSVVLILVALALFVFIRVRLLH
eukprot:CAMPEP_0185012298 /NCGR_PEP_ID=MMETSP1098-20130426/98228_1 /TAXON_ID=89044 /ORGANISM="Spumella elongata, Strain CCAP 955/1" /LENGTH=906 /DNA_ID=CAMNT_0027541353 /DNA_START=82 /DNA_END=2803 /DNA_ORIENTATION=+